MRIKGGAQSRADSFFDVARQAKWRTEQRPNASTLSVTLYKRLEGKLNTLPSIKQNQNSAMSSSVFVYIESLEPCLLVQPSLLVFLFACIQRQKMNLPVTVHPLGRRSKCV